MDKMDKMVQATLYLLHYNNYYNRLVKQEQSLSDYLQYQLGEAIQGVNFIPNDFVDTKQKIPWPKGLTNPDYLVVVDEEGNINSRWFIISTSRVRAGQLQLDLHRDLVVDYYEGIINAPMFIEKATVQNINDPAIFNSEDMSFNQIKIGETLIKDETQCPWIVGFIPTNVFNNNTHITSSTIIPLSQSQATVVENLSDDEYYKYSNSVNPFYIKINGDAELIINQIKYMFKPAGVYNQISAKYKIVNNEISYKTWSYLSSSPSSYLSIGTVDGKFFDNDGDVAAKYYGKKLASNASHILQAVYNNQWNPERNLISYSDYLLSSITKSGYVYVSSENKFYRRRFIFTEENVEVTDTISNYSNLAIQLSNGADSNFIIIGNPSLQIKYNANIGYIVYDPLVVDSSVDIDQNRYHLSDNPYDMFCIPYSDNLQIHYLDGTEEKILTTNKNVGFSIATAISKELSNYIYDLQLLPFCPVREFISGENKLYLGSSLFDMITLEDGTPSNVILWGSVSTFNISNLTLPIQVSNDVIERKIETECDIYRFCSPNYSGIFEFNASKNNGVLAVNVDCTYKPFNSYIHINPNFGGLYGNDFNDQRGLICGGDFSLPQVTDAWSTYELQNKNYQQIFDRQIQNMEVNNSVQREREIWNIASGALSAGISGAGTGAQLGAAGGPIGMAIGAGLGASVGTGLSIAGGMRDLQLNDQLRNEALDYTKDMYGYQLGNIKALPQGLAKVSAFTANNKIFPFLEKYSCTDEEKQALKNKLTYNGMTIMRIGTILEFLQSEPSYIKGKLIRLESIDEDFHIINAISRELYKGVFI